MWRELCSAASCTLLSRFRRTLLSPFQRDVHAVTYFMVAWRLLCNSSSCLSPLTVQSTLYQLIPRVFLSMLELYNGRSHTVSATPQCKHVRSIWANMPYQKKLNRANKLTALMSSLIISERESTCNELGT